MLALAMLAFGALVWGIFLLGRESFGWPVGALAAFTLATREPVPVPGHARLRGHPVPGAGGRRGGARGRAGRAAGAPVLVLLALAGLLRPEAWLLGGRLLALPAAGAAAAARGAARRPGRSPRRSLWALSDLAVTGDALHSLTFTRDTAETLGRPQGIENVPEMMPRRLGEILRWVPLVGGTAGFFLALRFARERAAAARRAGGARRARVRGDRDRRPVAARPLPVPAGGDAVRSSSASPRWAGSAARSTAPGARGWAAPRCCWSRSRARRSPTRPTGSTACATASSCAARSRTTCAT